MRTSKPSLSLRRLGEVYETVISCRRDYCADSSFPKMTEVWEDLCDGDSGWTVKKFRSVNVDYRLKTGVTLFENRAFLTIDERLWLDAENGGRVGNFILAHELGHLCLGHHSRGTVVKNFQPVQTSSGLANIPPTPEELEANYAGVIFQCGPSLGDVRWTPRDLARRAMTDETYVRKLQGLVASDTFKSYLARKRPRAERVIL